MSSQFIVDKSFDNVSKVETFGSGWAVDFFYLFRQSAWTCSWNHFDIQSRHLFSGYSIFKILHQHTFNISHHHLLLFDSRNPQKPHRSHIRTESTPHYLHDAAFFLFRCSLQRSQTGNFTIFYSLSSQIFIRIQRDRFQSGNFRSNEAVNPTLNSITNNLLVSREFLRDGTTFRLPQASHLINLMAGSRSTHPDVSVHRGTLRR